MKTTWNLALAALVVLGCVVTWSFAQPPAPVPPGRTPTSAPPGTEAGNTPNELPPVGVGTPDRFASQPPAAGNEEVQTVVEVTQDGRVLRTYRTPMSAHAGGGWTGMSAHAGGGWTGGAYGAIASDPETAKLYAAEEDAAKEAQGLTAKLKSITDEKERADAAKALRDALTKQFDAQQKRRAYEISKIEERLGKLKDTMKKRESAKDTIIGRRVDELTGVTDDLGWEESGIPVRVRAVESNYGPPGRVPASPPAYPGGKSDRGR